MIATTLADTVELLGPAYVKLAQILSTRADLLPEEVIRAMRRLYDQVRPPPPGKAVRSVPSALLAEVDGGLVPVAAGSIACVYRARLHSGRLVAVKARRPEVVRLMALDLTLLEHAARLVGRLPALRGAPVRQVVGQVGDAIYQQLDLVREAENLTTIKRDLADLSAVRIPAVDHARSGPEVLVQEFIPGLGQDGPVSPAARRAGALTAMRACFHMLFLSGLVHCDMHPGNVYVQRDGTCVILDTGFAYRLTPYARRRFAEFFYAMSRGDGARCADVVLETATVLRPDADLAGFRRTLSELVVRNSRVAVHDFDLIGFARKLFDAQRSHGLAADPQFVFPILALLVLDGTLRQLCPDVDFQKEAIPYVLRGLMV
ncbi:AarF/UbiB family protein [Micromonospora sp. NPDC126480]|uniref:ABC1 kinase family protein n=1 Tax=Micromonospora sp. NPDC126480 TaxID=3155312 RepID=UPI0033335CB6